MTLETIVATSWWMIIPLGVIGSVLHFTFDWSRHNRFAAVFSAVNESYWEHIKIAIWPVVLLQIVLFAAGGYRIPSFIPSATIALYSLPISMLGLVFLYKLVTKRNVLWLDIASFFMIIAIAQTLFVLVLEQLDPSWATITLAGCFLVGILLAFLRFTLRPPEEPDVFIDPLNKKYGIDAHPDYEAP
ncbi:DUF6512 family protein [Leucobacter denitrificans]|uniref:Uncharacterized protein n=1 Tax=Leucobacter denitrificans TaxID=683042 RepID=A0A7G9S478_9MICO|nr:DUF6512 family protein [Leucobacter denitrificans]QNN62653.1 hypothetical protein H9L06_10550 [Leucobacter denitrificans]